MRGICKPSRFAAIVSIFILVNSILIADIGGGEGRPITPYGRATTYGGGEKADADTVQRLKSYCASHKSILYVPARLGYGLDSDKIGLIRDIGIAYLGESGSGKVEEAIKYFLYGVNSEGANISIDFAEIKSIEILGIEGAHLIVQIKLFPAIEPVELLKKQPNYIELRNGYEKTVVLRILPRSSQGFLWFVGIGEDGQLTPIERFDWITYGEQIVFYDDREDWNSFWWAIPSVCYDRAYPHRLVFAE